MAIIMEESLILNLLQVTSRDLMKDFLDGEKKTNVEKGHVHMPKVKVYTLNY